MVQKISGQSALQLPTQQPKVTNGNHNAPGIVVIQKGESSISTGIGYFAGRAVFMATLAGGIGGSFAGAASAMNNYGSGYGTLGAIIGACAGAFITGGALTLLVRGVQTGTELAADAAIWTAKLPFRVTYGVVSGTCNAASAVGKGAVSTVKYCLGYSTGAASAVDSSVNQASGTDKKLT